MAATKLRNVRSRLRRRLIRWSAFAAAVALGWPGSSEGPPECAAVVLPALSPFVALGSALSIRSVGILALLALPLFLLAWSVRCGFCRFACPVGLLQDTLTSLRSVRRRHWIGAPAIGPCLLIATATGAVLGHPLFLWLDPLALFAAWLTAWRTPIAWIAVAGGLGLPALLIVELFWPGLWCARICPLGAGQRMLWQGHRLVVRLIRGRMHYAGPETSCGADSSGTVLLARRSRRHFLAAGAGVVGAAVCRGAYGPSTPLRPPGAASEEQFGGLCVRCGNCARVCPSRIIHPDVAGRWSAWMAPRLDFTHDYCREDCHRCNAVCPSGAIARLSLAEKSRRVIGLARLDPDTCLMALGRECNACVRVCPYKAIAVDNTLDPFSPRPRVDLDRCNGCGACESVCPTRPERAMRVRPVDRETGDQAETQGAFFGAFWFEG